ncbi:unnamed protein product [Penicillium pancosmium]
MTVWLAWHDPMALTTSRFLLEKDLALMPLANLRYGIERTKSKAWHSIKFVGALGIWPGFKTEVKIFINKKTSKWKKYAITMRLHDPDPISHETEQILVADELGIQGRWPARVRQPFSVIARNEKLPWVFGDSKGGRTHYDSKVTDLALTSS